MRNITLLLIVFFPFLVQFKSPIYFISLGELLLIPLLIIHIIKKGKINIDKSMLALYTLPLLNLIVVVLPSDYGICIEALETVIRAMFYFYVVALIKNSMNSKDFFVLYVKAASIFSAYLIAQYVLALLEVVYLPVLPTNILHEMPWYQGDLEYFWYLRRLGGLFVEPSRYIIYVMPAFCIAFYGKRLSLGLKRSEVYVLVIGIGIICSTSGIGYITLATFMGFEIIKRSKNIKMILVNAFCVFGSVAILAIIQKTMIGVNVIERLLDGGSIGTRMIRGLIIWSKADFFHKLFGVGVNNVGSFVEHSGIYTIYDEVNLNYVAGFTYVVVTTGLLGTMVLISFLIELITRWRRQTFKILGSTLLVLSMFEADVFTYKFAFLIIVYSLLGRRIEETMATRLYIRTGET